MGGIPKNWAYMTVCLCMKWQGNFRQPSNMRMVRIEAEHHPQHYYFPRYWCIPCFLLLYIISHFFILPPFLQLLLTHHHHHKLLLHSSYKISECLEYSSSLDPPNFSWLTTTMLVVVVVLVGAVKLYGIYICEIWRSKKRRTMWVPSGYIWNIKSNSWY